MGEEIDLYFPLWVVFAGVLYDGLILLFKNTERRYFIAGIGAVLGLVIAQELQNPVQSEWSSILYSSILYSLIGGMLLSILFVHTALKKTMLNGYHAMALVFVAPFVTSSAAWAHNGAHTEKIAPNLHPFIVLGEFLIIFYVGYWIAHLLSNIQSLKSS